MHWSVRTSVTLSACVLAACAPGETKKTDTVVADAAAAKVTIQPGEGMGSRHEAQTYLDSAMVSFTAKRYADAAKRRSLGAARELAAKLANGIAVPATEVDPVLTALDTQLHALMKQVATLK